MDGPAGWVAPIIERCLLVVALVGFATPIPAQVPGVTGAGPVVASDDGEVRTLYWDLFEATEVWVKIVPIPDREGPNPTTLYFSITFPGRQLTRTPPAVRVVARSNLLMYPRVGRTPTLSFVVDGAGLDLTAQGQSYQLSYPCSECAFDGVIAEIPLISFFRLLGVTAVRGDALGFGFQLDRDDLKALNAFAAHLVPPR